MSILQIWVTWASKIIFKNLQLCSIKIKGSHTPWTSHAATLYKRIMWFSLRGYTPLMASSSTCVCCSLRSCSSCSFSLACRRRVHPVAMVTVQEDPDVHQYGDSILYILVSLVQCTLNCGRLSRDHNQSLQCV